VCVCVCVCVCSIISFNLVQEQIARMRARNTELREQMEASSKAARVLQGLDIDEFPMPEMDELKNTMLQTIQRVDIAKVRQ
ncbi:MAG: hypothetical protein ACK41O_26580, partial [Runella zeae]